MIANMEKDYQEPTDIMIEQFNNLNNKINNKIDDEKEKFVNKLEITKEEKEELVNLEKERRCKHSIFKNMKLKTKDSDIISINKEEGEDIIKRV